ncbi:unnamed protein product [Fusarium graminearum]|nr:unnamed protein product [Fusarium graminearum]VTO82723.1 unnamed protein product [Fusarium graminearum]
MPQLKPGGRELQALADIRLNLWPLIEKRITDSLDSRKVTSLAMYNRLHFFKYELMKMPLDLTKGQDLSQEDYESFLGGLHRLLEFLEGLIDEDILRSTIPPPNLDHKFEALIERASKNSTSSNLSTLLLLPETDEKAMEANQIITDFNAENLARSKTAARQHIGDINAVVTIHRRASDEPTSGLKLEGLKRTQKCLSDLRDALVENISISQCTSPHIAKLQIRYPEGSTEPMGENQHRIFVSCCSAQNKWQETMCKVVSKLPANSNLRDIRNFCKVIQGSLKNNRTLEISVHNCRIVRDCSAAKLTKSPPVWPTLSLDAMLRDMDQKFRRMQHAGMQNEWTSRDIFFLFDHSNYKVAEAYNPCLAYSLFQQQAFKNFKPENSRKFSLLVAFGKLLLEIALGRPVEDSELHSRADVALLTIVEEQSEELMNEATPAYHEAMVICLEANQDDNYDDEDMDDMEDSEKLDEEGQCMEVLFTVVERLEKARTEFPVLKRSQFDPRKSPNYPLELQLSKRIQSRSPSAELNKPHMVKQVVSLSAAATNAPNTNRFGSFSQLFDDRRHDIGAANKTCDYAQEFFVRAETFHTENINRLPSHPRIRIAILDTGVDESNPFFRGVRQRRIKRDAPFKATRSFVGEPEIDELGHGTNVAALMLKISPEADIYIAKISHGQEVVGTYQIVEAIRWAQDCNVHIISMSFGLSEDNDAIENAIGKAENDGVIIFAAASNYGGNARRAFPARMDKVLCVHASDGNGNKSGLDPSPKIDRENFSTLGVAIESIWEDDVYLSGTSYSTPVAADFAANVLRYVQHCCGLEEKYRKRAFSRVGMKNILLAMSDFRDGYHYVTPWRKMWDGDVAVDVAAKIKQALKDDKC